MRNSIPIFDRPLARQSLLLVIMIMTSFVLTCYALLWLYAKERQKTIGDVFLTNIIQNLNDKIDDKESNFSSTIFTTPPIIQSYQLVLFEPNGHTVNINSNKNNANFRLPTWSANADNTQTLRYANIIEAWRSLDNHYVLYAYIEFKPVYKTFNTPWYFLPIFLFFVALLVKFLFLRKIYTDWYHLLDYTNRFYDVVQSNYRPLQLSHGIDSDLMQFEQLINRLTFKTHQYYQQMHGLIARQVNLIDKSPTALFIINRKGHLLYFNEKFAHTFATTFSKNKMSMLIDFVTGQDKATQQLLTNINEQSAFLTLSVTDLQRTEYFDLRLNPFYNDKGQLQGYSGSLALVTNYHEQQQKAWIGTQQTAVKLAGFDKLWAVLGHELRTPLSGMMGMIELLLENKADFNQEQQETIATIQQSSQTMLTLLNDMLDVAKLDAGKLHANISSVDLIQLLQQVSELMIGNAKRVGISLYIYTQPDVPRLIQTDDGRMRQIILNLMSNAVKFTKHGYVALLVDKVDKTHPVIQQKKSDVDNLANEWLKITVKDTGIGIAHQEQQKLFSYFNQANDSISQQFGGTGLGLAISNNFSQLLGGFIHLESHAGKGSEFQVFLPLVEHSLQPVFNMNIKTLPVFLIIASPFDIVYRSTEILNFMEVPNVIFTDINQTTVDKVNQLKLDDLQPIFIIDELSYKGKEAFFEQMPLFKQSPKIIASMDTERTIDSNIMVNFDALIQKPPHLSEILAKVMSLYKEHINPDEKNQLNAELAFKKFLQQHKIEENHAYQKYQQSISTHQYTPVEISTLDTISSEKPKTDTTQNKFVLVAEDNPTNQKIAQKHLQNLGYTAIIANNGDEAIKLLNENRMHIGLVLMDCQMPILDGLTATRLIRQHKDSVPIVALTANDSDEDRKQCSDAGMDGFLTKPVTKQKLTEILTRFMV